MGNTIRRIIATVGSLLIAGNLFQTYSTNENKASKPEVSEYSVSNSVYTLVHVRQVHKRFLGRPETSKERERVIVAQKEIYNILTNRISTNGLKEVYQEGYYDLSNTGEKMSLWRDKYKSIKDKSKIRNDMLFELGAPTVLALEEKLDLRPSEDFVSYIDCLLAIRNMRAIEEIAQRKEGSPVSMEERLITDNREDSLLKIISSQYPNETNKEHVVVYGAGHNWSNNIVEWNLKHPNQKFSLITITPPSLVSNQIKN